MRLCVIPAAENVIGAWNREADDFRDNLTVAIVVKPKSSIIVITGLE